MTKIYYLPKKLNGEILNIYINRNGYVAIISTDATYKSIISLFDSNGKQVLKKYLATTRVSDLSISEDNNYIALAEIDTSGAIIKSNVEIISVEKAISLPENSVVNSFENNNKKMIVDITYQEKNNLVCVYDDSIDVIAKDNEQRLMEIDENVTFISGNLKNSICYIREEKNGIFDQNSTLNIINTQNNQTYTYNLEEIAKEMYTTENVIGINIGTEIYFINTNGILIKKYVSKQEITNVIISNNLGLIVYKDKIEMISL